MPAPETLLLLENPLQRTIQLLQAATQASKRAYTVADWNLRDALSEVEDRCQDMLRTINSAIADDEGLERDRTAEARAQLYDMGMGATP